MRIVFVALGRVVDETAAASAELGAAMQETSEIDSDRLADVLAAQQHLADGIDAALQIASAAPGPTEAEGAVLSSAMEIFNEIYMGYRIRMASRTGTTRPFAYLLSEIQQTSRLGAL